MYTMHTKKLKCLINLYFVTFLFDKCRGSVTLIYENWQKQRKTEILSSPINKEDLDTLNKNIFLDQNLLTGDLKLPKNRTSRR